MPIVLGDIFTAAEAQVLAEAAGALEFGDGGATAGPQARAVKRNLQAVPGPARDAVLAKVEAALSGHDGVQALAYPARFAALMVTRTEAGGGYGAHIDNALMAGGRADLSFTIFLSDPDTYEGGALAIEDRLETRLVKLGRGEAIIYPSDRLHRVEEVTRGTRLVVVGWIESRVADPRGREILFDLWRAETAARETGDAEQALLIGKSRSNLLRMWAR